MRTLHDCFDFFLAGVVRRRVAATLALFVLAVGLLFSLRPANSTILPADSTYSIQFTSAVPLQYPVVCSTYFRQFSTPVFVDTLPYVSGTNYTYRKVRSLDTTGTWHFKFFYRDSVAGINYAQWSSDIVFYDTLSMQGAASGLTAAGIWSYAERTVTGWGGDGLNAAVLRFKDSSDSTDIQGLSVRVYDTTTSNPALRGGTLSTNSFGRATFNLNAGTYDVRTQHNNYVTSTTEFTVPSGDTSITFYLTPFDPGDPATANLIRVWGYVADVTNTPATGVLVTMELRGGQKVFYHNTVVTPYKRADTTDANGYWQFDLYAIDSLTGSANLYYRASFTDTAGVVDNYNFVPPSDSAGASWQFTPGR